MQQSISRNDQASRKRNDIQSNIKLETVDPEHFIVRSEKGGAQLKRLLADTKHNPMSGSAWEHSEDFGQKVDLTVRIREILRNYPEGLSILKELIQNADDAGARTIKFVTAEPRPRISSSTSNNGDHDHADPLSQLMKGPSLLAFNSAKFTDVDFKSIQQIGDSLKKDVNGTKTGRFGVGVNSTYHLTDVPMFASGSKVVMFDPQAKFVPGINPANPGKMIDCSNPKSRALVESLPHVFDPLKVFGCDLSGKEFDGTLFRFALRTEDQAEVSRLSRQAHLLGDTRDLLRQMAVAAPTMLLFLKNVECIEIYDWKASDASPTMLSRSALGNASDKLRMRRSYVLNAPSRVPSQPQAVDYILDIETTSSINMASGGNLQIEGWSGIENAATPSNSMERWMVCNQLGGGNASIMANKPELSHMKLVPWAGVAARLSPGCKVDGGNAYCFLPLPVKTKLPIHVNGYFELSSNRRDVWWGDDMAGDGKARAEWNRSIVQDIAAPSYIRLISAAIRTNQVTSETYELLFPQKDLSGPWKVLGQTFLQGVRDIPVLYSKCTANNEWVAPSKSLLLHDDKDEKLSEILSLDRLPLVLLKSSDLKAMLIQSGACKNISTPDLLRRYFATRKKKADGCLEAAGDMKLQNAEYLLTFCKSDLNQAQYSSLSGCQFVPLASGGLGRFCTLPAYDKSSFSQLRGMGFSQLLCAHALRISGNNVDRAMEWLLTNRYSDEAVSVQFGVDPYLVCSENSASLLRQSVPDTFVDLGLVNDPGLKKFFDSGAVSAALNVLTLQDDMLADIVLRAVPSDWRGSDSAPWNPQREHPNVQWFVDLWRFICSSSDVGASLKAVAEQFCIVPTNQGVVCSLSPGNSIVSTQGLASDIVDSLVRVGVRTLLPNVLPSDLVVPPEIYNYIFDSTRDGVIRAIDAASRREHVGMSSLEGASDDMKDALFHFFVSRDHCPISTPCKVMIRNFPIFRSYTNSEEATTNTVTMSTSAWYIIEGATEEEKMFMTSDFLKAATPMEVKLLTLLGAKVMARPAFFKKVVIPQLSRVDSATADKVIEKMLLNLPSMCAEDPDFAVFLSNAKFVRSSDRTTLQCPSELYDPEVPMLLALMNQDSFPDEFYMHPNLLLSLRKVGLQSTLSWDTVLECARSIEYEATRGNEDAALSAKARGSELLLFLDMNVETFFPEFTDKSKTSRTGRLFRKMNAALFEDTEKLIIEKEMHAKRVQELLSIKWMPVHVKPPQQFLPWPEHCESVASPVDTVTSDKMWLASYSKRLVDGDVHSHHLKQLFGWLDTMSINDVSLQLRMMSKTFQLVKDDDEDLKQDLFVALCQKYSSEVGRMYHILNNVESDYDLNVIRSCLHGSSWLWMGDGFVSSDHIAYTSSINAQPYLFTVPPDLACFRNLLSAFNIRTTFGSSDYCMVLIRMAKDTKDNRAYDWGPKQVELAVNLVQKISDDVLRLNDLEIYAPTQNGDMEPVGNLVYDDAPWLSKDLPGKKGLVYAHPKLSASVCDKIGVKSVRKLLLQNNADMISFGDGVVHEAFGQSESLTRRLKNIVEMYPEGTQQLSELIQNADDAKASVVKFVISKKQHGTSSLLGQKMSEWQGGALYCYNDATFTARDFKNLSQIGQASKLEKLVTTGRFGLGFNSVFHWTDVPSVVSSDSLVMFDPHAKYVPGATDMSRGIKIRFTNTDLASQFPDQMDPYCLFGNDMKQPFNGTLFRFPFRNTVTAVDSEISKKEYGTEAVLDELISNFKNVVTKTLLFLRHVQRVEFYVEEDDNAGPQLQFYADISGREEVKDHTSQQQSGLSGIRNLATNTVFRTTQSNDWNAISNYIAGDESQPMSKEGFYSKLLRTPESQLPKTKHIVTINFVDRTEKAEGETENVEAVGVMTVDRYLICSALGAGQCRAMACNPEHRDLKFLPWANIAAHLTRNGKQPPNTKGNAFCFLPLPAETGFAVHINGYFELSANRRDIWSGSDMTGAGKVRSDWNRLLLWDVISPLYTEVLLSARMLIGPGEDFNRLWPTSITSDIWKVVRSRVYQLSENLPIMFTPNLEGKWVSIKSSVFLETENDVDDGGNSNSLPLTKKKLLDILLQENLNIVTISSPILKCMRDEACEVNEVSPQFVREWFKKPLNHPSLSDRESAIFLLRYCIDNLFEGKRLGQLHGLPLLPLANGDLGYIVDSEDITNSYFVVGKEEKYLLEKGSHKIVDVWTTDTRLNGYLMNQDFHHQTNVGRIDAKSFVRLLADAFPSEWEGLPEVHWQPDQNKSDSTPSTSLWLSRLWDYISSEQSIGRDDMHLLLGNLQIIPTLVGEQDKTLQVLLEDMAVVNVTNLQIGEIANEGIAKVLRTVGIRTLDTTVFQGKDKPSIFRLFKKYIQPPTARGIIAAMVNSFPEQVADSDIVDRMKARFKYIDDAEIKVLRNFLRDSIESDLSPEEIMMLRTLPIYEVFHLGNKTSFSNLVVNAVLPPSCADKAHLGERFVRAGSRRDADFFAQIGVSTMSPQEYYVSYVPNILSGRTLDVERSSSLIIKMLQDTLRLSEEEGGEEFIRNLSVIKFVPNARNEFVRADELYDPQEAGLVYLVDESMLPATQLRNASVLQSLRLLGMSSKLTGDGILESARQIELQAKNLTLGENIADTDIAALRQRAVALLNFLDDDDTITELLSWSQLDSGPAAAGSINEGEGEEIEIENIATNNSNSIVDELSSISWLPVERPSQSPSDLDPPRRTHQLSIIGISSPKLTRTKVDEWLCSSSMDILSSNIKSDALLNLFKWNVSPSVHVVSSQLIALSRLSQTNHESHIFQQCSKVSSQIYEILDNHIDGLETDEKQRVLSVFQESAWIWVGDGFVKTSQVAFNAPEHAKPFLYNVPDSMICYETLLKACGVRDTFSGEDFIRLLCSLSDQLGGSSCGSRQLDLAIFVARSLSRIPHDEFETLDKAMIYLPSRDGEMHRAGDMTYDDAPWLSAIVKKTRHVFVHPDVGNEVARNLGAKSLRDVLSANQNGMVKIPCPKFESLHQLLKHRDITDIECCRTILEIIEIAEMKGVKQVSVMIDYRSHGTMSLVHPCLAPGQGPSIMICFHDSSMEVDEVVRLTSPAKYYSSTISGCGGGGGSGFPRYGRGFCGAFALTDCLQVLSGRSLLIFDPTGNYLIEDKVQQAQTDNPPDHDVPSNTSPRKEKANARNYGLSHSFCKQFPDQFDPFFSLSAGVEESLINGEGSPSGPFFRGTIIRIPLRTNNGPSSFICDRTFLPSDADKMIVSMEEAIPRTMLFSYNLQSVSLDTWKLLDSQQTSILSSRVSSSPLARRSHLEEQADTKSWRKEKSKIGKLFKTSWVPKRSYQMLQLSTRKGVDSHEIVDSYAVHSILGPSRLREMACTESLEPLNLIPTVSIATHLDRSHNSRSLLAEFDPPQGTLFVGFDTGIQTGLPFFINAPLFLHEMHGSVLLQQEDDSEFKAAYPGIRNVVITDKHGNAAARSLAFFVWNRQALTSAVNELVPRMFRDIREPLQNMWSRNPKLSYKFWPYRKRIRPEFKDLFDATLYTSLADKSMPIFLTQNDGFKSIDEGCFASPEYQLREAANFFLQHMALFTTPRLVVDDLAHYGIGVRQLTPSVARSLLKENNYSMDLSQNPREGLTVLQYCLADFLKGGAFDSVLASSIRAALTGLKILPLADGSIGQIGDQIIVANAEQQAMMPMLKHKFLSLNALKILEPYLNQKGFEEALGLQRFGPIVLAKHISKVLPSSWEGKDFVSWDPDSTTDPSKLWIYQFWKEISFSCHDQVQLFRRWPLIPTKTGELASCGNSRFILYLSPSAIDESLQCGLSKSHDIIQERADLETKRALALNASGNRLAKHQEPDFEERFWNMGEPDDTAVTIEPDALAGSGEDLEVDDNSFQISGSDNDSVSIEDERSEANENAAESSSVQGTAVPGLVSEEDAQVQVLDYDSNSSDLERLYEILITIRCPLLDGSYFTQEELKKSLPSDRLGVSRGVMSTLNQCINYWPFIATATASVPRLDWSALQTSGFDSMLSSLSSHDGNRLSLMLSDLSSMKILPIFETFAGSFISIQERDANFTVDASVDVNSITAYLPLSLQSKLLADKPQFKELYEDLNVQVLNEATILQKFVLREFPNMPLTQKEAVIKNILDKWEILRLSDDLVGVLKETAFVKRTQREGLGEVVFVKPSQLFDPRHQLLSVIFDKDKSLFPAEEFVSMKALEVLESVGLQTKVDKDTFVKCAWVVEEEQDVDKATVLFEYFAEHFGDFYDNNQQFTSSLGEIRCVPGEIEGKGVALYRFRETAAPKDRHLTSNVMPVMFEACAPPQVMFSSLGIVSPPPIAIVLRQIRALTESHGTLDSWTYKHGTVEQVFSELFSFLQDNFSDLSPRVKEALADRPMVPVGSSFVKARQLFFRLAKDLSPFFYEVPRAFGAYDVLLRQLGVRDTPKSGDYAVSLKELNREIGATKLNANELNSVIEVVKLAASEKQQVDDMDVIYAPDQSGKLVCVSNMMQNDKPWLIQSGRIDTNTIHLAHPKLTKEICSQLRIGCISERVMEVLDESFNLTYLDMSLSHAGVSNMLKTDVFIKIAQNLTPKTMLMKSPSLHSLNVVGVEAIKTRFILLDDNGNPKTDISNAASTEGPLCFIDKERILLTRLPIGISSEIAVASALCEKYKISREHMAGLSALLSSQASRLSDIQRMMGLFDQNNEEVFRGEPGYPLGATDLELIEIKPLKMFKHNEIVAIRASNDSSHLVYGTICETQDTSSMSRLRVCIGNGIEKPFLSSQVYSLKRGMKVEGDNTSVALPSPSINVATGLLLPTRDESDVLDNSFTQGNVMMSAIRKEEVLAAVDDLLKTADLSLNNDVKTMMVSNLSLKEQLSKKANQVNSLKDNTKNILEGIDSFLCPITREIMEDPVVAKDGHTYERESIEMWFRNNSRSPKTNSEISTELVPNYALKSAIEAMSELREALKGFSNA